MDYSLTQLRVGRNILMADMVDVVKKAYPKFDKPLLSKCMNPALYGVRLQNDAEKEIFLRFDPEGQYRPKKADRHKHHCCIRCRMDEETYSRLLAQIHQDGFATVQDWLWDHVQAYINARSDDP